MRKKSVRTKWEDTTCDPERERERETDRERETERERQRERDRERETERERERGTKKVRRKLSNLLIHQFPRPQGTEELIILYEV